MTKDTSSTSFDNLTGWDTAVASLNNGDSSIAAIQNVWNSLPPQSSTLLNVATIVGAIYADTYWATNQLSASQLAGDMEAAQGWNGADCQIAAAAALSSWSGLLLRGNFNNYGEIPKQGTVTESPDVLVNAAGSIGAPTILNQWNSSFYNAAPGGKNYAYGRAASINLPVPIAKPVLSMFATPGGFNQPPNTWQQLYTFDGQATSSPMQGNQAGPILPGGRAANTQAFDFQPPGAGHYCLIAVAATEFFTNAPLASSGNMNLQTWITCNGAAGWHNLDTTTSNEATLKFANQDATPERFVFEAHCNRLPAGTQVSLSADGAGLLSNVDSGKVKINRSYQVVAGEGVVGPAYLGDIQVRFVTPDGKALPPESAIEVRMSWVLAPDHPHYGDAVRRLGAIDALQARRSVRLPMGSYRLVGKA